MPPGEPGSDAYDEQQQRQQRKVASSSFTRPRRTPRTRRLASRCLMPLPHAEGRRATTRTMLSTNELDTDALHELACQQRALQVWGMSRANALRLESAVCVHLTRLQRDACAWPSCTRPSSWALPSALAALAARGGRTRSAVRRSGASASAKRSRRSSTTTIGERSERGSWPHSRRRANPNPNPNPIPNPIPDPDPNPNPSPNPNPNAAGGGRRRGRRRRGEHDLRGRLHVRDAAHRAGLRYPGRHGPGVWLRAAAAVLPQVRRPATPKPTPNPDPNPEPQPRP